MKQSLLFRFILGLLGGVGATSLVLFIVLNVANLTAYLTSGAVFLTTLVYSIVKYAKEKNLNDNELRNSLLKVYIIGKFGGLGATVFLVLFNQNITNIIAYIFAAATFIFALIYFIFKYSFNKKGNS